MKIRSSKSAQAGVASCIVCKQPTGRSVPLCSRDCLLEARRERDANMVVLRQKALDGDALSALAARNGYLTSALIRWSP